MFSRGVITAIISLFLLVENASSHYVFSHFIANNTIFPEWQYVRHVLPNTTTYLQPHTYPHYDLSSTNIRCGRGATTTGPQSDVATIIAGQEIGFRLDFWNGGMVMFHEGPLQAYLSRSSVQSKTGVQAYEGDGDWFKIWRKSPFNEKDWWDYSKHGREYNHGDFNFTLPATTPPGFYLLRVESIYPSRTFNRTQFYMSCAQVQILGDGNPKTEPSPMAKFPGAYDNFHEGVWISDEVENNLTKYKYPGPELWEG